MVVKWLRQRKVNYEVCNEDEGLMFESSKLSCYAGSGIEQRRSVLTQRVWL